MKNSNKIDSLVSFTQDDLRVDRHYRGENFNRTNLGYQRQGNENLISTPFDRNDDLETILFKTNVLNDPEIIKKLIKYGIPLHQKTAKTLSKDVFLKALNNGCLLDDKDGDEVLSIKHLSSKLRDDKDIASIVIDKYPNQIHHQGPDHPYQMDSAPKAVTGSVPPRVKPMSQN